MTALRTQPLVAATLDKFPGAEIADGRRQPAGEVDAPLQPRQNYSLTVLADTAEAECRRILNVQEALVAAGDRTTPHAGELQRAFQFEAIARLLRRCAGNPAIINELRQPVVEAAAGRGVGFLRRVRDETPDASAPDDSDEARMAQAPRAQEPDA